MKKLITLVMVFCMMLTLAACGSNQNAGQTENVQTDAEVTEASAGEESSEGEMATDAMGRDITELKDTGSEGLVIYEDGEYPLEHLTIGTSGQGTSLAPQGRPVWGTISVRDMIFQKLLRIDTSAQLHYELLKDMQKEDDLTYTLIIWDNIYDSAGNHITSEDVAYCFELFGSSNAGSISRLDHLEVVDDTTLIWHCKEPFQIGELGRQMSAVTIFSKAAMEGSTDEMVTAPVGSGPYVLESFTPGSGCVMTVNEDFWMRDLSEEDRAGLWYYCYQNVKELEFQVIADPSSRAIALEMGTIDFADSIAEMDMEAFKGNPDILPIMIPQAPPVPVIFNASEDSPCQDVNLRKAVAYAIDSAAIQAGIGETAFNVYGFFPFLYDTPAEWKEERDYYSFSIEKAKEYLEKSSYNGEELTLMYCSAAPGAFDTTAIMVSSQLSEVGINITLNKVDTAVNEVLRFQSTDWDIRMDQFSGGDYCVQVYKNFYSGTYLEMGLEGKNLNLVVDEKLDSLYEALEADPENEQKILDLDDYFTNEMMYGYSIIGYSTQTASRNTVTPVIGERGVNFVPGAFTANEE